MFASAPTGAGGYFKTIYSGPLAGTILWNPSQDELYSTGSQRNTHIGVYIYVLRVWLQNRFGERKTHICVPVLCGQGIYTTENLKYEIEYNVNSTSEKI